MISLTPWAQFLLYPFKLFTTWVHETGHALMTVLVGGHVTSITIRTDTSGVTRSLLPAGRVARGLVASSGYLGAAVVGCLLMASTRVEKWAHVILRTLGAFMLVTLVLWMRNLFGVGVVLAWSLALITLAQKGAASAVRFFLSLLAIQVALNAVYDIRVVVPDRPQPVRCGDDGPTLSAAVLGVGHDVDAHERRDVGCNALGDSTTRSMIDHVTLLAWPGVKSPGGPCHSRRRMKMRA